MEGLAQLDHHEIKQTLQGATLVEILAESDMTLLQMAMKAKCFPTEGNVYSYKNYDHLEL